MFSFQPQPQVYVKDPLSLMAATQQTTTEKDNSRSQFSSPMQQLLQSQLGLTPQQLQVLMHHQQQQLAFQSVSR